MNNPFQTFNLADAYNNARSIQQLQRLYNGPGGNLYGQQNGLDQQDDLADDPNDSGALRQLKTFARIQRIQGAFGGGQQQQQPSQQQNPFGTFNAAQAVGNAYRMNALANGLNGGGSQQNGLAGLLFGGAGY